MLTVKTNAMAKAQRDLIVVATTKLKENVIHARIVKKADS
jgi:hypothetical protein